jgi:outer membrane protein
VKTLFLLILLGLPAAAAPRPLTLAESFTLALRRSEELAQSGEAVAELEAQTAELRARIGPQFSLVATETLQDVPPNSSGVSSQFTQRNREQAQVAVHQPLFTGLREFLALRALRARGQAAEFSLRRARQRLYGDVAQAYVEVLSVREETAVRRALAEITDDRIKELRSREKLGRSRKSEVLAAEAQRARITAQLETARGRQRQAQLALRFLTGLQEDLAPAPLPGAVVEPLPLWLEAAARRPDVEAARLESRAAALGVDMARRLRWPALSLDGNYYLKRPPGFTDRVKWDAALRAELPLYSGGGVSAQVDGASAARRAAEQGLALALRRAVLETESAHDLAESAVSIASALEKATELAEANAKAQAEDYRLGLVTNLDVLGSLNALLESRLSLAEAGLNAALARSRLAVAAGLVEGAP